MRIGLLDLVVYKLSRMMVQLVAKQANDKMEKVKVELRTQQQFSKQLSAEVKRLRRINEINTNMERMAAVMEEARSHNSTNYEEMMVSLDWMERECGVRRRGRTTVSGIRA